MLTLRHRTLQEPRRPPFSVAAALRPLLDFILALGKVAVSFSTPLCLWFIFSCPKTPSQRAPTDSGNGAAVGFPNFGQPSLLPNSNLISAVQSRSNGPNQEIPLRPNLLQKEPLVFKESTRGPKRTFKNMFSYFEDVFSFIQIQNTFSGNYKFATEFVLFIKYSS
jgi:hypothetical protein